MKYSIFCLLFLCCLFRNAFGQAINEECPYLKSPNFNIFIRGYGDTVQANSMKARTIEARSLNKGIELLSSDTLVSLRSFQITFAGNDGNLYSMVANGSKANPEETKYFSFQTLSSAAFICIDRISVEYNGRCYVIPAQVYYMK